MKSRPIAAGQSILASQNNDKRDDARGASFLLAHQQLGALALGTNPSNGQVVPVVINGTTITITFVTAIGSTPNNVLIGAGAAASVTNLLNFLRRPDLTNANQVAASGANQQLLAYVGWALPGNSTNIVPFSLNKNVNGITGPLTSFNITGITVTSGTWTAQTMQLYIEDGTYYIGTTRVLFTGASTPTFTAPVSNPRIDIVTADSSGTIAITQGSENVSPTAPAYPVNKVVICEVYNVVGETALYDNENQQAGQGYVLNDVRQIVQPVYISSSGQVATQIFIPWISSPAQGDVAYFNGSAWARLPAGTLGQVLQTNGASANPSWGAQPISAFKAGINNYSSASGTQTIAHGLGKIPIMCRITAGGVTRSPQSVGTYDGTTMNVVYDNGTQFIGTSTSYIIYNYQSVSANYTATITWDATNLYVAWTKTGGAGTVDFLWEVMG